MIGEDVCKKPTKEWTEMEEAFRHKNTSRCLSGHSSMLTVVQMR